MNKGSKVGIKGQILMHRKVDKTQKDILEWRSKMKCPYLHESAHGTFSCNTGGNAVCFYEEDEKKYLEKYCKNMSKLGNYKKCITYKEQLRRERMPLINKFISFSISLLFAFVFLLLMLEANVITVIGWAEVIVSAVIGGIVGLLLSIKS